jgi:hypothetical protein
MYHHALATCFIAFAVSFMFAGRQTITNCILWPAEVLIGVFFLVFFGTDWVFDFRLSRKLGVRKDS